VKSEYESTFPRDICVKISLIAIFSFSKFSVKINRLTYFFHIAAAVARTDGVTYYVVHRVYNTNNPTYFSAL